MASRRTSTKTAPGRRTVTAPGGLQEVAAATLQVSLEYYECPLPDTSGVAHCPCSRPATATLTPANGARSCRVRAGIAALREWTRALKGHDERPARAVQRNAPSRGFSVWRVDHPVTPG